MNVSQWANLALSGSTAPPTLFPPLSKSLPIVSTLLLNADLFSSVHATDTPFNARNEPVNSCLTRGDHLTFFPRGATLLCFSCFAVIFARLFRKVSVVGIKGQLNLSRDFFKQRKCSECLDRDSSYDPVGTRLMFLWRNLVLSDCLMSDLEPDLTHPKVAVSCSGIARHLLLLLLFAFCCVEIELRWWCATLLFHINRSPIRYHVSLARNGLIAAIILTLYGFYCGSVTELLNISAANFALTLTSVPGVKVCWNYAFDLWLADSNAIHLRLLETLITLKRCVHNIINK